tara:strand:- start:447 stop:638 length:192 start_codon:yes stop_codon:yes gene_type:complete
MEPERNRKDVLTDFILRGFRIGASTIAILELLRSDWTSAGLASLAWLIFVQVEKRRSALKPPS